MHLSLPDHYHSLRPFRQLFSTGVPILMYHKIAPRPRQVRLKGLYVTPAAFVRQVAELSQAGYAACTLAEACANGQPSPRVALTFDDGFRNVFQNALAPLAHCRMRALQFLVAQYIGKLNEWDLREGEAPELLMDAAQVRDWLGAGHAIGSHSLTHARLTRLTLRDAREEIFASRKRLEDTFGVPVEHFSYPYGDWSEAACTTEFGVNTPATPPYALRRITVRRPTRTFRTLKARLLGAVPIASISCQSL
jgi:peptidoglycan/xylan/chitin deacetylase (PgdA/CDA1 family)